MVAQSDQIAHHSHFVILNSSVSGPAIFSWKSHWSPNATKSLTTAFFCCIECKPFLAQPFFLTKTDARPPRPSQARNTQWRWLIQTGAGNAQSLHGSEHHMHRERLRHSTVVTHAPSQTRPGFAQTWPGLLRPCCELSTGCRWQGHGRPTRPTRSPQPRFVVLSSSLF